MQQKCRETTTHCSNELTNKSMNGNPKYYESIIYKKGKIFELPNMDKEIIKSKLTI